MTGRLSNDGRALRLAVFTVVSAVGAIVDRQGPSSGAIEIPVLASLE